MAARKPTAPRARPRAVPKPPALPPITTARFKEAMSLIEALGDGELPGLFIDRAQEYRTRHREGTKRPLTAAEAAQIATGLAQGAIPDVERVVEIQQSDLGGYEEPDPREILFAGGVATAPAFVESMLRFVVLVEMPAIEFMAAREEDRLDEVLDTAVKALDYEEVDGPNGTRARTSRAYEHFAKAAGAPSGKTLGLFMQAAWKALEQAVTRLGLTSPPSSLIGSPPPMDGPDETSSTTSPTSKPSD